MAKNNAAIKYNSGANTSGIRNVRRFVATNDNNEGQGGRTSNRARLTANNTQPNSQSENKTVSGATKLTTTNVVQAELVWSTFLRTLAVTSIIYMAAQLFFGIACLIGLSILFGVDSSFVLSGADLLSFGTVSSTGGIFLISGMMGAMLCGLITFMVSVALFTDGKCKVFRDSSLLILTVCTILLLTPILNLFPIMWFWNWYVAWSNLKIAN